MVDDIANSQCIQEDMAKAKVDYSWAAELISDHLRMKMREGSIISRTLELMDEEVNEKESY